MVLLSNIFFTMPNPFRHAFFNLPVSLKAGDILIVSELSRLGRSVLEVVGMVEDLLRRKIEFISIKQNLRLTAHDAGSKIIVTIFSLVAELERDFISSRTKTALARKKAEGV